MAGETACPTSLLSECAVTRRFLSANVETPEAGETACPTMAVNAVERVELALMGRKPAPPGQSRNRAGCCRNRCDEHNE